MERLSLPLPQLLLILLALFHLFVTSSNAIPSTRVGRILQQYSSKDLEALNDPPERNSMISTREGTMEYFMIGRMDMESNDYPGSGANNRHTPKPPGRRLLNR